MNEASLRDLLKLLPSLTEHDQVKLLEELEILEQLRGKEEAQTKFMTFVRRMWPGFINGRHHSVMADAFERVANGTCKRLIVCMPPRHRLHIDTPVATIDGWKDIKEIGVGDYVFAPDGQPVLVTGKSKVYEEELYEVTTNDGQYVVCDGSHLWTVRFRDKFEVYDTECLYQSEKNTNDIPYLPPYKPVQPPYKTAIEDAYTGLRSIRVKRLSRKGLVQCIEVANSDGLFLAGRGYIVTHNTKSEFASFLLPAWYLGRFPDRKIIQASHTAELAVGFGRKVRNLIDSPQYKEVFPSVELQADSKAAGRWGTNHGGEYFAIGVSGSVSGKGGDIVLLDDLHSEQEATIAESNPSVYDKVYDWFMTGPRQRLQPHGAIVIVNTRWSKRDLTGRLLKDSVQRGGDEWEVIEFPALFEGDRPLWPEYWSLDELLALRKSLPLSRWSAQYLQNPVSESAAIIKREWWKLWERDDPPTCNFIIQSWDTAFLKHERADYSACTTWGVFYKEDDTGREQANIILLDAMKDRLEFPELKQRAMRMYIDWSPDAVIVEAKAAGSPLIFEMRRMGIPVREFTPSKGVDKIARLNAVADIFASGRVWAPNRSWAEMVIEEVASFPSGEHDDLCLVGDTLVSMADGTSKRIEAIIIGDKVKTPEGSGEVTASSCTGFRAVWSVELETGVILEGTGNHKVSTPRGWVRIDGLNVRDCVDGTKVKQICADVRHDWVFNLTVETEHCYYANGVLVKNCDSTSQALLRFRSGGFIQLQTDEQDAEIPVRRKAAYY